MKKIIPILFISLLLGQETIDRDPIFIPGEEYKYDFHWLYVPVASLSINSNEPLSMGNGINLSEVKFQLYTKNLERKSF